MRAGHRNGKIPISAFGPGLSSNCTDGEDSNDTAVMKASPRVVGTACLTAGVRGADEARKTDTEALSFPSNKSLSEAAEPLSLPKWNV